MKHDSTVVGDLSGAGSAERNPRVSVVLPVLNEADDLEDALQRIAVQTHDDFEVVVADGGSTDGTVKILKRWSAEDHRFRYVHNPGRIVSTGLNVALEHCRGEYLVRIDGHSFIAEDYVQRCVDLLDETGAGVVGGRMVAQPIPTVMGRGIALANESSWGAGPARFHTGTVSGPVETVYLGAFRTQVVRDVGGFAEDLVTNQDYELNHRIGKAGHVVWLDVDLEVGYRPRSTLRRVAIQYFRYGRSKPQVMRRHPDSVRIRQVLPAMLVPAAAGLLVRPLRVLGGTSVGAHSALVLAGAARSSGSILDRGAGALAALTMHWSWSAGFWYGMVRPFPEASGG